MADCDQDVPSHRIHGLYFRPYSDRYVQLLSVKDIINPQTFDILQHATGGGLYDPTLGIPIVYPIVYIDFKILLEIRVVL